MRKKEFMISIIEELEKINGSGSKMDDLQMTSQYCGEYFQAGPIPYREQAEGEIIERILSLKEKNHLLALLVSRPVLVTFSFMLLVLLFFQVKSFVGTNSIKNKVAQYLSLNRQTFEFVCLNNMDKMVQTLMESSTQTSLLD
ncbi:MAG: hypothetical protein PHF84_09715, partial [bacterium]|nr:hypothetical protein [bacterium]